MAIVNHKYRYVFLAEKHCASRVLRDVLTKHSGSEIVSPHHATVPELLTICSAFRQLPGEFTTFSVVRNPADILVTMRFADSFQDYMRYLGCNPRRMFFQHAANADVILRYDNLESNLNTFLKGVGAPEVTIPHKEEYVTGGKQPWPSYYEARDIDYILGAFPEIAHFGYTDIIRQEWEEWQLQMTNESSSS